MKKVRITVIRKTEYSDLMEKYENPMENPCCMKLGQVFISENGEMPENFCSNAWRSLEIYVKTLASGGGNFFNGWMKNPYSALVSCDDGFRPVSFLLEAFQ